MLDTAGIQIAQGHNIAAERMDGVNDNMSKSHFHDYFELYYLESGERYHMINDDVYCMHSGEFILFAPYVMHHSYGDENVPFRRILVYFRPEEIMYENILQRLSNGTGAYQTDTRHSNRIHQLLDELLKLETDNRPFSREYQQSLLNILMMELIRLDTTPLISEHNNTMSHILNYIHQHYQEEITLETLAELAYMSTYHLCRKFKETTNSTVVSYINTTRIMNAQRMIMETNLTFTQISQQTGFANVTHFNRIFKKMTGITPSQYRKSGQPAS